MPRKVANRLLGPKLFLSLLFFIPLVFFIFLIFLVRTSLASSASSSSQTLRQVTAGSPAQHPPYGLNFSEFTHAITSPISNNSFPCTGYNTSTPAGPVDGTSDGYKIPGWGLDISVAANVPLTNSTSSAISEDDKKNKVAEVAVLSLTPPVGLQEMDEDNWRVCAIVFTGGLSDTKTQDAQDKKLDGTCEGLVSSECVQELQVNSVANGTDRNGGCGNLGVPESCAEYFGRDDNVGVGYGKSSFSRCILTSLMSSDSSGWTLIDANHFHSQKSPTPPSPKPPNAIPSSRLPQLQPAKTTQRRSWLWSGWFGR